MNKKVKDRLFKRSMWTLLAIFFGLIMVIFLVAGSITSGFTSMVDSFFGAKRFILVAGEDTDDVDSIYYKNKFAKKDENGELITETDEKGIKHQIIDFEAVRANSMEVCERMDEDGYVLLWNKNNALPLKKGDKISNFGVTSLDWVYTALGSSRIEMEVPPDLKQSLISRGFEINETMWKMVEAAPQLGYAHKRDMPWSVYSKASKDSVAQYGDAAIYCVSRVCGEAIDLDKSTDLSEDGTEISFSKNELGVLAGLKELKDKGSLKKIIVVVDCATPISVKGVEQYADACIWAGWGGSGATDALADILVGNVNPSGKLTDTWVYSALSAPANKNFGRFDYSSLSPDIPVNVDGAVFNNRYVVYQEGIYVGYRYYETRYEDTVTGYGNANAADGATQGDGWNYADEVSRSFGHGESYTTFDYGDYSVKKNGSDYEVSMTITNTGNLPGKDVMQVYVQKPYTQYDRENGIEKAAVELVGFEKTRLLNPGDKQTLTVTVPEYEFKSYDANNAKTYILEKGDYYLAVGNGAHDALNNILAAKGYTTENGMDKNGNARLAYKTSYAKDDFETYSRSPYADNYKITNRFDDADVNKYEGMAGQSVIYLSRNDWSGTYPRGVMLSANSDIIAYDIGYEKKFEADPKAEMPKYGTVTSEYGMLTLIQMKGLPFDDPLWDDLLNQMTFTEQVTIASTIGSGAESVAAPGAEAWDGPCGVRGSGMPFPCNPIVAASFNKELSEELGEAFGMESQCAEIIAMYGLASNIHRSAFGGRASEYFSEDGYLSGKINSCYSKGLRNLGVILYDKHFLLNEQETCRQGVQTWANEQSIRELYLKAFEIGIADGNVNGIMTSYNRIGAKWTGAHKGLLTEVLVNEWGFNGITVTDAPGTKNMHMGGSSSTLADAILAGQMIWLGNFNNSHMDVYKNDPTICQALREISHRTLYTYLYSYAMNGMTSSTRVVKVTPGWEIAMIAIQITSSVLMGLCLCMVAASWILWYLDDKKNRKI